MKRRKPQLPSPETEGVCVCSLRGLTRPLALVCVCRELRGADKRRHNACLTSHPVSVTLGMPGLPRSRACFLQVSQSRRACKQELHQTGPGARETAGDRGGQNPGLESWAGKLDGPHACAGSPGRSCAGPSAFPAPSPGCPVGGDRAIPTRLSSWRSRGLASESERAREQGDSRAHRVGAALSKGGSLELEGKLFVPPLPQTVLRAHAPLGESGAKALP